MGTGSVSTPVVEEEPSLEEVSEAVVTVAIEEASQPVATIEEPIVAQVEVVEPVEEVAVPSETEVKARRKKGVVQTVMSVLGTTGAALLGSGLSV